MSFKSGIRQISFRYDIIRNGVEYSKIESVGTPSITMVASAEIKTSLSGMFVISDDVDLVTDHIRPYMYLDGIEHALGEFIVGASDDEYAYGAKHTEIEAYDLGYKVKNSYLSSVLYKSSGSSYLDVIQEQLLLCGINRVIADPCSATLATSREDWEIGTSRLQIINDLLAEINFNSLWFDSNGNARLTKYVNPTAENAAHTYKADEFSIIAERATRATDMYGAYNDFIAIVSGPDYDHPLVATSTNDNPASALSVQRIGKRTAPLIRLNNIASQSELQTYVDNVRNKSMLTTEVCGYKTALMPHQVGETVILDHPFLQGVYEETEWTMPLEAGGEMTHKGKRVMYL